MNKKYKGILIVTGLCLITGFIYFIYTVSPESSEKGTLPDSKLVEFKGADLEESKDGKLSWRLTADKILVNQDTKVFYLTNIKATLENDAGKEIVVTAEKGTADLQNKIIALRGDIQAKTNDGAILQSEIMDYTISSQQLTGSGNIKITKGDTVLTGDVLTSDVGLELITLKGNTKMVKGGNSNES